MSKIKVNKITNRNEDGPVELTKGATIPSGKTLNITGNVNITGILTAASYNATNINATGIITATNFVGNGSQLTSLPSVSVGKMVAYKYILGDPPLRS